MRVGILALAAAMGVLASAGGQMSEEEKRALFLKAREDIRPVPKATASPTPRPKPRPAPQPTPRRPATPSPPATPTPRPSPPADTGDDFIPLEDAATPRPSPTATLTPRTTPTPRASPRPTATPRATATPDSTTTPRRVPPPKETPPARRDAPIVIEKSGLAEDEGLQPLPARPRSAGWFKRYRYLTPEIRRAIDRAPVRKGQWQYIIVHNSATRQGNAKIFDTYHRNVRKMKNGLAYHFVIGNGRGAGNGEIEIGDRWRRQINGGHVASDYLNRIAIGICLVGDLNRDLPTAAQIGALEELIDYLRGRVGKTKGKPAAVRGHKQINPRPTDCPGDRFDLRWLRRRFGW